MHKLVNVDRLNKNADCISCGFVKIKSSPTGNPRCSIAVREYQAAYKLRLRGKPDKYCQICKSVVKLVWDHDHATNLFRGWLCSPCNMMLGLIKDDVQTLQAAIVYLKH